MKSYNEYIQSTPVIPKLISLPLKIIPSFIHNKALTLTLNKIFYKDLREGELNFLQDKVVQITISDAGIKYRITLNNNKLVSVNKTKTPDLILQGTMYDYMLLASRREDTDTLFFNRSLHMQGDTELGLYLKNFLDGLDMDSHKISDYFRLAIQKILPHYERMFERFIKIKTDLKEK